MRLIGNLPDIEKAREFHYFLQAEGIPNRLEQDNGDCSVWIVNEEDLPTATQWIEAFKLDPDNPMFYGHLKEARSLQEAEQVKNTAKGAREIRMRPASRTYPKANTSPWTLAVVFVCTCLFIFGQLNQSPTANWSHSIQRALFYDYPRQQELLDHLSQSVKSGSKTTARDLSPEDQALYQELVTTQSWHGIYPWLIDRADGQATGIPKPPPIFERIQKGEVWRIVTPIFLHAGIFHIFFNMMWLIALGSQIESRAGSLRYVALILSIAILSNTAQYLMSGSNFLGISGVICGMATFIWVRQGLAPWEGYNLPSMTFYMLSFFVLLMLGMQLLSFTMEALGSNGLGTGIANTAHLSGAMAGLFLAKLSFFEWQQ